MFMGPECFIFRPHPVLSGGRIAHKPDVKPTTETEVEETEKLLTDTIEHTNTVTHTNKQCFRFLVFI